jgi:thermitase
MSEKHPRLLTILLVVLLAFVAFRLGHSFSTRSRTGRDAPALSGEASRGRASDRAHARFAGKEFASAVFSKPARPVDSIAEDALQLESLRQRLTQPNVVPGEALLTFRNKAALDRFIRQASLMDLQSLGTIPQLNAARVRYGTVEALRDGIAVMGGDAIGVEGNLWLSIPQIPPQPDPNNQQGTKRFGQDTMSAINADGDRTHWGDGVTVAVVDTGILAHPTFADGQITHLDLLNDGQAFNSHGTSVASLIGGKNPQAPGVAPGAQILDVRVANEEGYTIGSLLAEGIIAATDRGAQVINVSFGGYGDSAVLEKAVSYAAEHNAVVVAAAGNEAYTQLAVPAAYEGVISVGSVDANNRQAYFSNSGQSLQLSAPGVGVITAWDTNMIAVASGTSQSSALVSAAAAAYISWGVSPGNVAARLEADAHPTGALTTEVGAGVLMIKPPAGR